MPHTETTPPRFRGTWAFSLIELIVATAIFSIMGLLIFTVINNTSSITARTSSRLDANRVARECLDLIGQDLNGVRISYNTSLLNTAVPAGTNTGLQMSVNPSSIDAKFRHPHSIFWQTAVSRSKKYGDLAAVGYFVLRDVQSDPSKNRLQLRRLFVEPENPASPPASPEYLIYSAPTAWHPDTLLKGFAPDDSATDNANGQRGWVADGVLAMWVRCLDPLGNPITTDAAGNALNYSFNSRLSYRYTDNGTTVYPSGRAIAATPGNPRGYDPGPTIPAFIEVGLVCISPRDVRRLTALPAAAAANPTNFQTEIQTFANAVRTQNPQLKSVESFSRKYRLFPNP